MITRDGLWCDACGRRHGIAQGQPLDWLWRGWLAGPREAGGWWRREVWEKAGRELDGYRRICAIEQSCSNTMREVLDQRMQEEDERAAAEVQGAACARAHQPVVPAAWYY